MLDTKCNLKYYNEDNTQPYVDVPNSIIKRLECKENSNLIYAIYKHAICCTHKTCIKSFRNTENSRWAHANEKKPEAMTLTSTKIEIRPRRIKIVKGEKF